MKDFVTVDKDPIETRYRVTQNVYIKNSQNSVMYRNYFYTLSINISYPTHLEL